MDVVLGAAVALGEALGEAPGEAPGEVLEEVGSAVAAVALEEGVLVVASEVADKNLFCNAATVSRNMPCASYDDGLARLEAIRTRRRQHGYRELTASETAPPEPWPRPGGRAAVSLR